MAQEDNTGKGDTVASQLVDGYLPHIDVSAVGVEGQSRITPDPEAVSSGTDMEVDDIDDRSGMNPSGFVLLEAEEEVETEEESGSVSTVSSITGSVMSFTQDGPDGSGSEDHMMHDSAGGQVRRRNNRERASPMASPGSRRGRRGGGRAN